MYRLPPYSLFSTTTTTEPVSALPPHILFPFFQSPPATTPPSNETSPTATTTNTTTSSAPFSSHVASDDSTGEHAEAHAEDTVPQIPAALPYSVTASFISLPSSNSHQSILLPLPTLSTPFDPPHSTSSPPASIASSGTPLHPSHPVPSPPRTSEMCIPPLVFSHGSTAVDTYIPSTCTLERTLYSWSQLIDNNTMYCWNLPATTISSFSSSSPSSVSIVNGSGRLCSEAEVQKCPGHSWVTYSYSVQAKQWQERREPAEYANAKPQQDQSQPQTHRFSARSLVGDGAEQTENLRLGARNGKMTEVRVMSPTEVFNHGVYTQGMVDVIEEFSSWSDTEGSDELGLDNLCTTEGEEGDDLTDIDV